MPNQNNGNNRQRNHTSANSQANRNKHQNTQTRGYHANSNQQGNHPAYRPISPMTTHPHHSHVKRRLKRRRGAVSALAVILVVTIFVSLSLLIVRSIDWDYIFSDKTRQPFNPEWNMVYGPYLTERERDGYLTQYVTVNANDIHRGSCILVNLNVPYIFDENDEFFSVFKNKTKSYKVTSGSVYLHFDTIQAMNRMMDDFYAESENRNIMVNSGYRSEKQQKQVYDEKLQQRGKEYADQYVQQPGYSEHHTGYAMDLAVYDEGDLTVEGDEAVWTFDGKGEYFWVDKNCADYGFILRYSASKEDVTMISYESWHYRYVGIGNALAIKNMGLALEEYINFVKDYTYQGTRYYVTAANKDIYCIYYVPSSGKDGQKIPIPKIAQNYQISGNNIDGFIVTALVGKEQD